MQPSTSYTPLEPNSLSSLGVKAPSFSSGNSVSFFATSSFLYSLFFVAIVAAAFSRYVIAGGLRMQASESSIRLSNEIIRKVTLGLLGVFSLFIVLVTINKGLVSGDIGLGDLKGGGGVVQTKTGTPAQTSARNNPSIPTNNDDPSGWNAIKNDSTVRAQLSSQKIYVNKSVCIEPTQTSCTTVGGLPQETLSMLSSLRSVCDGTISITGGSETGHKSHGPGKTPVDLSMTNTALNDCIQKFAKGPNVGSWCKATYSNFGYIFCDEYSSVSHWHVYK